MNVRFPSAANEKVRDHICEMQLHLRCFLDYKGHAGHQTYEMVRTLKLLDSVATAPLFPSCTSGSLAPGRC